MSAIGASSHASAVCGAVCFSDVANTALVRRASLILYSIPIAISQRYFGARSDFSWASS